MKKFIGFVVTLLTIFFCSNILASSYNVYLENQTEYDVTKIAVSNYNVTPLTILQTFVPNSGHALIATGIDNNGINSSFYMKFSNEPDSYWNTPLFTLQRTDGGTSSMKIEPGLFIDGKVCLLVGVPLKDSFTIIAYPCQSQLRHK